MSESGGVAITVDNFVPLVEVIREMLERLFSYQDLTFQLKHELVLVNEANARADQLAAEKSKMAEPLQLVMNTTAEAICNAAGRLQKSKIELRQLIGKPQVTCNPLILPRLEADQVIVPADLDFHSIKIPDEGNTILKDYIDKEEIEVADLSAAFEKYLQEREQAMVKIQNVKGSTAKYLDTLKYLENHLPETEEQGVAITVDEGMITVEDSGEHFLKHFRTLCNLKRTLDDLIQDFKINQLAAETEEHELGTP